MCDWDLDKKVPISTQEFIQAVNGAMKTEPFANMINDSSFAEFIFTQFGVKIANILFEERTMVEK